MNSIKLLANNFCTLILGISFWGSLGFASPPIEFARAQGLSTYFIAVVENSTAAEPLKKILKCDPSVEVAKKISSGRARALLDGEIEKQKKLLEKSPADFGKQSKNCLLSCSCNSYLRVIGDDVEPEKLSPQVRKLWFRIKSQSKLSDSRKTLKCARAATWICKDPELKEWIKDESSGSAETGP